MAQEICVVVSAEDCARLATIIDARNRPLKHIRRAQIILFSVDRLPVLQMAQRVGASRRAKRPIGRAAPWPRRSACRCAWCSASEKRPASGRIASEPSNERSNDPAFAEKVEDVVGPLHAPAGACRGAADRREIADSNARPHSA
jgi:hypothetical protein